jgi:hypothetical protein
MKGELDRLQAEAGQAYSDGSCTHLIWVESGSD